MKGALVALRLRLCGAKLGRNLRVFGKLSTIDSCLNLTIGNSVTLNEGVHLNLRDRIEIGDNCHISSCVQFHTGYLQRSDGTYSHGHAPIRVENNVWIASSVVIGAGVVICSDVVIGANSFVNRSIAEPGFYAGNPVRKVD